MNVHLQVLSGPLSGTNIPVRHPTFIVGREGDCQLRPNSPTVSRHHCVFLQDGYTFRVRDLGSTTGTFVNGRAASGDVVLSHDDLVKLGEVTVRVDLSSEGPGPMFD